jgi:hypothetical protein
LVVDEVFARRAGRKSSRPNLALDLHVTVLSHAVNEIVKRGMAIAGLFPGAAERIIGILRLVLAIVAVDIQQGGVEGSAVCARLRRWQFSLSGTSAEH